MLENTLVDEIRRAMWRLRRCGIAEEGLLNPDQNEAETKIQFAVDRARSQSHRLLHKCTAELRKLQTDRRYRDETFEAGADIFDHGLADWRQIRKGLDEQFQADYCRTKFSGMAEIDAILSSPGSFCKTGFAPLRRVKNDAAKERPVRDAFTEAAGDPP